MTPIVIRASRKRQILVLLAWLVALGISIVALALRGPSYLALIMAIVSGVALAECAERSWKGGKQLVIDDKGIWSSTWPIGVLRWKEIKRVFARPEADKTYLCFVVCDRDELRLRLGSLGRLLNDANRATGFGDIMLPATKLGLPAEEIAELANKKIAEA